MMSAWTKHLTNEEEKKKFENEVLGSKRVLAVLSKLIDEKMEGASIPSNLQSYEDNNWAYKQAHKQGYLSLARNLKQLLNVSAQPHNLDQRITT